MILGRLVVSGHVRVTSETHDSGGCGVRQSLLVIFVGHSTAENLDGLQKVRQALLVDVGEVAMFDGVEVVERREYHGMEIGGVEAQRRDPGLSLAFEKSAAPQGKEDWLGNCRDWRDVGERLRRGSGGSVEPTLQNDLDSRGLDGVGKLHRRQIRAELTRRRERQGDLGRTVSLLAIDGLGALRGAGVWR